MNRNSQSLNGVRVLVVEDEFAVLLLLEDMLSELGCEVAGTASRLREAIRMANESSFDAAVLDVNINGEPINPVAEILAARGVPMVFSTGYGRDGMDPRWRSRPVLQKPYRVEELAAAITRAMVDRGGAPG